MQHDPLLRAVAREIYGVCYPTEDWAPTGFEEAERLGTVQYRQSVDAARRARTLMTPAGEQLPLFGAA